MTDGQEVAVSTPVAELVSVSYRYGEVAALTDVDLALYAGHVTALLGPNGAGKTTAVSLLTGLMRPTTGEARLFGTDPRSMPARRRMGVMLQVSRVPDTLTVREHLHLFSAYYPTPLASRQVLTLAGLEPVADRRFSALSGGQKQRALFALAICGNPELLFLDEPTVGMDVEARRGFWQTVRAFAASGRAVLLTTHYLEEADALANRIVVINRGRVVADGRPEQIKAAAADRQVICRTQLAHGTLRELPGVTCVEGQGDRVRLVTRDAEATTRALLSADESVDGLEVRSAGLEDGFLALTGADGPRAAA
ncbi:MAG TPA: ABC transporter ATP-binding protein [Gemmatimonadaceae bacterium]|nr:ABC transporter ATP-binding protein [Gemmatimonadaceae bacterium]